MGCSDPARYRENVVLNVHVDILLLHARPELWTRSPWEIPVQRRRSGIRVLVGHELTLRMHKNVPAPRSPAVVPVVAETLFIIC